jgi:hypothetical protein
MEVEYFTGRGSSILEWGCSKRNSDEVGKILSSDVLGIVLLYAAKGVNLYR